MDLHTFIYDEYEKLPTRRFLPPKPKVVYRERRLFEWLRGVKCVSPHEQSDSIKPLSERERERERERLSNRERCAFNQLVISLVARINDFVSKEVIALGPKEVSV